MSRRHDASGRVTMTEDATEQDRPPYTALDEIELAARQAAAANRSLRRPRAVPDLEWLSPARVLGGLWRYTPLLILALAWEGATRLGLVSPLALPSLDKVAHSAWWGLAASGDLSSNAIVSLSRGAAGLGSRRSASRHRRSACTMAWYRPVRDRVQPGRAGALSDAEIRPDPGRGAVARVWQRVEDIDDLYRLHAADPLVGVQRRARGRPGADLVGAEPRRERFTSTLDRDRLARRATGNPRRHPHRDGVRLRPSGLDPN